MKKTVKPQLLDLLKTPRLYFYAAFIFANLLFTRQILQNNGLNCFVWVALIEIIVEGLFIFFLERADKKGYPLEKRFLILAIGLGALFIIFLPPGQSPDEITHYRRAYGISEGVLVATEPINELGAIGSPIPIDANEVITNAPERGTYAKLFSWLLKPESEEKSNQPYTNFALYNFICYLPQTLAALIGKVLGFSTLAIAYLMKIFDFIVWLILTYFAIKLIPKFKTFIAFVALLPITIQEATSLSPDSLAIGLGLFMISYVLYLAHSKKDLLRKRELIILYVMAILAGLCKIVYFPLALLYLAIPKERFGSKKQKLIHLCAILSLTLLINLSWLSISSGLLIEFNPGVDPKAQVLGVLSDPLKFIMVIFRTIVDQNQLWLNNMLGITLGSFNFNLSSLHFLFSFGIFIILIVQRNETLKITLFSRIIFGMVFVMIVALIFASLYVEWTAYGAGTIDGVQGRYFLPILPLIPIVISRKPSSLKNPALISERTILSYSLFVSIIACVTFFAQNL